MITIRRIAAGDASLLREIRLRALSDTLQAFGSTFARESVFDSEAWSRRATLQSVGGQSATFFAFDDEKCCGLIGCFRDPDKPRVGTIVSMWVDSAARRQGVGRQLIDAVEQCARQSGFLDLALAVVETNAAAARLYESCGFSFTGAVCQYPNDPALQERLMEKSLRPSDQTA